MSYRFADSKLSANLYVVLCVQSKTPDDGQRNCPKHVEFYSKNKFEKLVHLNVTVKWSRYRPGVAQRVGRVIALLIHDRGTRRAVSGQQHASAALYPRERPRTHFTGGWVDPRSGLDGRKISSPPGSIPKRPARRSVAIPTELLGPQLVHLGRFITRTHHDARSPERQILKLYLSSHNWLVIFALYYCLLRHYWLAEQILRQIIQVIAQKTNKNA